MSARAWGLFVATAVVWGIPYYFIKVAVEADVPPAFVAWSRIALAAVLLAPLAVYRGSLRGLGGHGRAVVAYAGFEIALPFTLIAAGEQRVASSLTAILIASMPLAVALLSFRFLPGERPTRMRMVGLAVGLGGVVALLGVDVAGETDELIGAGLILVATLSYATATIIVQRGLSGLDPLGPVAAGLCLATVVLAPAALLAPPPVAPSGEAIVALVVLGVLCTAAGLLIFFRLIAEAGPGRASVITYVNPFVAVLLGVALLDEHLGVVSVAGLALILFGSWLATLAPRRAATSG